VEEPDRSLLCRSYTHARRYPWVIGRICGWQLPTQLTPAQLGAMAATLFALVETRSLWAHLPRMLNLLIELGVPVVSAWAVRHLRMEGRSPVRALAGLVGYLMAPRGGLVQGRPHHEPAAGHVRSRVFVLWESEPGAAP
jgi:hypothetical protein